VALLEVRELELHYGTPRGAVRAVDGLSFTLERAGETGETLGVIGETGSGKSSLLLALTRLLPANVERYAGQVLFEGSDLMRLSDERFRRQVRWSRMAVVFQGAMNGFNPVLRVGAQLAERLLVERSVSAARAREQVETLLEATGLPRETWLRYPHELSGGMKQRAAIAMALTLDPPLLLLDEPTSALDVSVQAQIMNLLKRLKWERGLSMLFITHDIALASDLSDRVAVMYAGQLREIGSAEELLRSPADPYTQELLASIPRLHGEVRPRFLSGTPPDPASPPPGCRFHPRCPRAFAPCPVHAPPLFEVGGRGHLARCWLHAPPGQEHGPAGRGPALSPRRPAPPEASP
jgi:oligopeptide/dipeptide ABC transporter ATP-binding protein